MRKTRLRDQAEKLQARFPSDLKKELVKRGMSQRELAAQADVDESMVSRLCHGLKPGPFTAAAIVEALDG